MSRLNTIVKQLPTVLLDIIAPYACYEALRKYGHLSDSTALSWTAVFPAGKVAYDLLRSRRIDVVGCIVIWEVILTVTLNALFHNARLILLKGPIQVAALAAACFVSLALRSPLAGSLAQLFTHKSVRLGTEEIGDLRSADPERMRVVTLGWGMVSVADAVLRTVLIFALPTASYLLVSRLVQTGYFMGMGLWTFRYLRAGKRIDTDREAVTR